MRHALIVNQNGNTTIAGNLEVGPSQAQSNVKLYFNHVGSTGFMMMEGVETKASYTLRPIFRMAKCL